MVTASQEYPPAVRAYLAFMREIKHRHQQISAVYAGEYNLTKMFVHDLGWLQLRLMCETVALACLVIHEEIPATRGKDLIKAYRADFILKKLQGLHPDYFPQPLDENDEPEDGAKEMVTDKEDGFLTLAEMIKLYNECDRHLHRGSFRSITNRSPPFPSDPKAVTRPLGRLAELLRVHTIQPLDPKWVYMVKMEGPDNTVQLKGYHRTREGGSFDLVRRRRK